MTRRRARPRRDRAKPAPLAGRPMPAGGDRCCRGDRQLRGNRHIRPSHRPREIRRHHRTGSPARQSPIGGDDSSSAMPSGPDRARGAPSSRVAAAGPRPGPSRSAPGSRCSGSGESEAIGRPSWASWRLGTRAGLDSSCRGGDILALLIAGLMIIGSSERTAARIPDATRFPRYRRYHGCGDRLRERKDSILK